MACKRQTILVTDEAEQERATRALIIEMHATQVTNEVVTKFNQLALVRS